MLWWWFGAQNEAIFPEDGLWYDCARVSNFMLKALQIYADFKIWSSCARWSQNRPRRVTRALADTAQKCSKRISGISALMAVSPKDHLHWLRQQGRSEVRSDPITEYWKGWTAEAHHQGGRVMWQGHMFLWWKIHLLLHARVASLLQVTTPAGYKIPESMQIQCLAGASCKSCCAFLWIQEHVWFCW